MTPLKEDNTFVFILKKNCNNNNLEVAVCSMERTV